MRGRFTLPITILPETNELPLKMDGWNTTFLLGRPIFRGYVSFREGSQKRSEQHSVTGPCKAPKLEGPGMYVYIDNKDDNNNKYNKDNINQKNNKDNKYIINIIEIIKVLKIIKIIRILQSRF